MFEAVVQDWAVAGGALEIARGVTGEVGVRVLGQRETTAAWVADTPALWAGGG